MRSLAEALDRLARFEPVPLPVISLYLNAQADERGKDNYDAFVRKELAARGETYPPRSPERASFDRDAERIRKYLRDEVRPSANGIAIFACAGNEDFFEAMQLDAPIERHRLSVSGVPHLYPLARLLDQHPRYAVVLTNTNSARVYVFGRGRTVAAREVASPKLSKTSVGGWSQMRYQRHVENLHLHHAKDLVEAIGRVVREERLEHILLAGDEVIIPMLRDQLPKALSDKVVDILSLDIRTPEEEVMKAAAEALQEHDAKTDNERVQRLLGEYRAGGLAVIGARETLEALKIGQVDELFLSASRSGIGVAEGSEAGSLADQLVAKARQTRADIRFIEDPALLAEVGGVGATLRYRLEGESVATREGEEVA